MIWKPLVRLALGVIGALTNHSSIPIADHTGVVSSQQATHSVIESALIDINGSQPSEVYHEAFGRKASGVNNRLYDELLNNGNSETKNAVSYADWSSVGANYHLCHQPLPRIQKLFEFAHVEAFSQIASRSAFPMAVGNPQEKNVLKSISTAVMRFGTQDFIDSDALRDVIVVKKESTNSATVSIDFPGVSKLVSMKVVTGQINGKHYVGFEEVCSGKCLGTRRTIIDLGTGIPTFTAQYLAKFVGKGLANMVADLGDAVSRVGFSTDAIQLAGQKHRFRRGQALAIQHDRQLLFDRFEESSVQLVRKIELSCEHLATEFTYTFLEGTPGAVGHTGFPAMAMKPIMAAAPASTGLGPNGVSALAPHSFAEAAPAPVHFAVPTQQPTLKPAATASPLAHSIQGASTFVGPALALVPAQQPTLRPAPTVMNNGQLVDDGLNAQLSQNALVPTSFHFGGTPTAQKIESQTGSTRNNALMGRTGCVKEKYTEVANATTALRGAQTTRLSNSHDVLHPDHIETETDQPEVCPRNGSGDSKEGHNVGNMDAKQAAAATTLASWFTALLANSKAAVGAAAAAMGSKAAVGANSKAANSNAFA